jgi:hypothetical protein
MGADGRQYGSSTSNAKRCTPRWSNQVEATVTEGIAPRGESRLRVLAALPQSHRDYFFDETRKLCRNYISSIGTPMSDRESETLELFSEVAAKLLGATSGSRDQAKGQAVAQNIDGDRTESNDGDDGDVPADDLSAPPTTWMTEDGDPKLDGRVAWLLGEIGGRRVLSHRYEDTRRRRWGRWQESGYRVVQISALRSDGEAGNVSEDEMLSRLADSSHPLRQEPDDPHHESDMRRVWIGILALAETEFVAHDDVSILLRLLSEDSDIQAGFGTEWPIRQIVNALNASKPARPWSDDRVDNAKKRLRNWIGRLKRKQGLDSTDLMAMFARYARKREQSAAPTVQAQFKHAARAPAPPQGG